MNKHKLDDLMEMIPGCEIEYDCIGEFGMEFTAYVKNDLIHPQNR